MSTLTDPEGESQDNFVEARDPAELAMCFILASAYLGLAKYCWGPLTLAKNWNMLINIEGFFIIIACVAVLLGLRPYITPCYLQLSGRGIKYRGPYWPQRKTVNWEQVQRIYVSSELIVVLYHPKPDSKRSWPLFITSIYLADREQVSKSLMKYCPLEPITMTSPHTVSRLFFVAIVMVLVGWLWWLMSGSG